jgi:hypothetical protein
MGGLNHMKFRWATNLVAVACSAVAIVGVVSCGGGGTEELDQITVFVSPQKCNVVVSGTKTFSATVTGTSTAIVVWSVQEAGGGTVDPSTGVYKAPATTGTYHVVAESFVNPMKTAVAEVKVVAKTSGHGFTNILFLHEAVGTALITQGDMRLNVDNYNTLHSTALELWDHGTNSAGLTDYAGHKTGTNYGVPSDDLSPEGLRNLWVSMDPAAIACRTQILANHEVIVLMSPPAASDIASASVFNQYKTWFLEMRDVFDLHPDKLFIVVTPPPLHILGTTTAKAANARLFANWLSSATFLTGHANVRCYDLFDALAEADDGTARANVLRYAYEQSHTVANSLPNTLGNQNVGPDFALKLCADTVGY